MDKGGQVNKFILDFKNAFNTPPHELDKTLAFLCYNQQKVVANGAKSEQAPVLSGVLQGTALGLLYNSITVMPWMT